MVYGSGGQSDGPVDSGTIVVTYPSGATCTVTKGSDTYTALDTSGTAVFIVEPGEWTVRIYGAGGDKSKSVTVDGGRWVEVELSYEFLLFDTSGNYNGSWKGYAYRPSSSTISPLAPAVSILSDSTMQTSLSGTNKNGLNANNYQINFSRYNRLYAEMYADFTVAQESSIQVVSAIQNNYSNLAFAKTTKLREWETVSVDVSNITTTGYVTIWLYVNTGTNKCITRKVWLE